MKYTLPVALAAMVLAPAAVANDNLHISGFGSVIGAQVVDGSGHVADYPNAGIYDDQFDLAKESKFGLQAVATINDRTRFTTQAMSRGANDFEPQVEWMFVNYAIQEDIEVQAGKLRVPVYYFSEYMDVGYAYPWIRVPSDAYSLDLTNFNGVQLNYRTYMGSLNIATALYAGRQTNNGDPLMSYLFDQTIDRDFTGIVGATLELSTDDTIVKFSYTEADMTQVGSVWGTSEYAIQFHDVYVQQSFGDLTLRAEYNRYKPFYESYFASASYRLDQMTYYVMYSKFKLDEPTFEEHDTQSVGVRYDLAPRMALKFDVTQMNDDGVNPFTQAPNPVNNDPDGDGDVVIISTGIDFIF